MEGVEGRGLAEALMRLAAYFTEASHVRVFGLSSGREGSLFISTSVTSTFRGRDRSWPR